MSADLPKHLHVIGICGVAMSAIAIAFHKRVVKVTGSDKGFFPPVSTELEKQGVAFYAGWHPERFDMEGKPDLIMVGTASGTQNPETLYAVEHGIPMLSYPEVLGKFFVKEKSVVCAGTWGKTSSSALLSFIFEQAKLDPSYMFGGVSLSHESSAKLGLSDWSVFEGDEYKSSPTDLRAKFFHYRPTHLLLTGVSWDHADLYPTEAEYFDTFKKLLSTLPTDPSKGFVVACADNDGVSKVLSSFKGKTVFYGRAGGMISMQPEYTYKNARQSENGIDFVISHTGKDFNVHSPMLGLYQCENLTGCFAMAYELGIQPEIIVETISKFKGLKRRMEKRSQNGTGIDIEQTGTTVIDDIAHSPEKATSVLATLRQIYQGKIIAVFEPNIGGREHESAAKYDNAFNDADIVVIPRLTKLKVAANASEQPMEGAELAQTIGKTHPDARYIEDDEELIGFLAAQTTNADSKNDGDVIAFLGSHGFRGMIEALTKSS